MKQNKKSGPSLFTVIFLIFLFAIVMGYLAFLFPSFSNKLTSLDTETQFVGMQVEMLSQYELQVQDLATKADQLEKEFAQSKALHDPILFSNILYAAADTAGVTIKNLTISEQEPASIDGGFVSRVFTANLQTTMPTNEIFNSFISTIEGNEGCAMYVSLLDYSKTEEPTIAVPPVTGTFSNDNLTAGSTANTGLAEKPEDLATLTITLYTVTKE